MQDDVKERWDNYRKANTEKPLVRENELKKIFYLLNPQEGERIWEVGTGNGYLTFPIAQAVGSDGLVVTTDVNEGNIQDVIKKNLKHRLPIEAKLLTLDFPLLGQEYVDSFDAVATIATLHHFDDRKRNTGESGRRKAIETFHRCLKQGGRLLFSDPVHGGVTQKYFDAIDDPTHCFPFGHPHHFFTKERLAEIVSEIGFHDVIVEAASTPWKFVSVEDAVDFVHTIHNAKCTPEESFKIAEQILGFRQVGEYYELGWELLFLTAVK